MMQGQVTSREHPPRSNAAWVGALSTVPLPANIVLCIHGFGQEVPDQ